MEQVDRPHPNGRFKALAPVAQLAGLAYLVWGFARFFTEEGTTYLTTENISFTAMLILVMLVGVYRKTQPDRYGVRLGSHEVLVRSQAGRSHIPLGEATVRLVTEDKSKRSKVRQDVDGPPKRQLFIEHSGKTAEVDIVGMLPAHVETYAADIEAALAKARWKLGLPEPGFDELEA